MLELKGQKEANSSTQNVCKTLGGNERQCHPTYMTSQSSPYTKEPQKLPALSSQAKSPQKGYN